MPGVAVLVGELDVVAIGHCARTYKGPRDKMAHARIVAYISPRSAIATSNCFKNDASHSSLTRARYSL